MFILKKTDYLDLNFQLTMNDEFPSDSGKLGKSWANLPYARQFSSLGVVTLYDQSQKIRVADKSQ